MMRFYGNMTQAQIGDQLGISQMHVSRLLTRALSSCGSGSPTPAAPRPLGADARPEWARPPLPG